MKTKIRNLSSYVKLMYYVFEHFYIKVTTLLYFIFPVLIFNSNLSTMNVIIEFSEGLKDSFRLFSTVLVLIWIFSKVKWWVLMHMDSGDSLYWLSIHWGSLEKMLFQAAVLRTSTALVLRPAWRLLDCQHHHETLSCIKLPTDCLLHTFWNIQFGHMKRSDRSLQYREKNELYTCIWRMQSVLII